MISIGWLVDTPSYVGGAELTQAEFRAAAPDGVRIVDCPADKPLDTSCDVYAIHNCVSYTAEQLETIAHRPWVKYWHDVGPFVPADVRQLLDRHARYVCCSPLQAEHMRLDDVAHVPPPVDLARFEQAANGERSGNVSVARWHVGKGVRAVERWAAENGRVDVFGGGPLAPADSKSVDYEDMPRLLASYERFVFLPDVIEPFARVVAEAWASGMELVINDLVGAVYWITEKPEAIQSAAEDYWNLVLSTCERAR